MIYPLLLDGEDQCTEEGYREISIPLQFGLKIQGRYLPFSYVQYVRNFPDNRVTRSCTYACTIMHASPPILTLNKQIRKEARSLFLQKHLTLSLHGIGPRSDCTLWSLEYWLRMLTPTDIAIIQRVELREFVWIVKPEDGATTREWGRAGTLLTDLQLLARLCHGAGGGDVWTGEIAAIELSVGQNGAVLEVKSRLEIVEREVVPVKEHLQALMVAKKDAGSVFDGNDLIAFACWLKVTDKIPVRSWQKETTLEILVPRWTMICSKEELEDGVWRANGSNLKLGFGHLMARAELQG